MSGRERPVSQARVQPSGRCALGVLLLAALCGWSGAVWAQTDEIQVYDAEITAPGHFNLTWHNNFTPSGRTEPAFAGGIVPDHALNGVPEWAYGVTPWFEAGLYLPIYTLTRDGELLFDGAKLRALFVVPHAHDRTFFYGINFELSYNTPHWDPSRFAGEMRTIVGVHLGRFDVILNPIVDTDFNGVGNLEFVPAVRVAWNPGRKFAYALEEYADFGPLQHFKPSDQQSHTLFAVIDYGSSSHGVEFGVGRGLTPASDTWVLKLMFMQDL
ncbi:MAG TPA: hypothetical protein VGG67_06595 [Steroidobacteraceae bacterium]|jgi:hypothetical protein